MPRHEGVSMHRMVSPSNNGSEQNSITRPGAATLADSVVAFARNTVYSFAHKPSNQTQGRPLQLNKILYS